MDNFISVTANEINVQGEQVNSDRVELVVNLDQVAAIMGKQVLLKGTDTLVAGNRAFKDLVFVKPVVMPRRNG